MAKYLEGFYKSIEYKQVSGTQNRGRDAMCVLVQLIYMFRFNFRLIKFKRILLNITI